MMKRLCYAGLCLTLLTLGGCGASGPAGLAKEMMNAVEAGDMAKFKSVAESVQKLSKADQEAFGDAFGKAVEAKMGNDPAKAMEFMGKFFKVAAGAEGGMPGMPGMPGGGAGGNPFGMLGGGGGGGIFGGKN